MNSATSDLFVQIVKLIKRREVRISNHGYNELVADKIFVREVIDGVHIAKVVEEYPQFPKGPCLLVLQQDREKRPIHVLWGIPIGAATPAVLITAYRPDPRRWTDDFLRRIE